jgi:hypothetical protein
MAAKIDTPFATDKELVELVELFESLTLPYERWTHRAHLAVAATYASRYPLTEATDRARTNIRRYNESLGNHTGYHETITVVFMRLVAIKLEEEQPTELAGFVNDLAATHRVGWLLNYYSGSQLWSEQARNEFLAPDLRPLDSTGGLRFGSTTG